MHASMPHICGRWSFPLSKNRMIGLTCWKIVPPPPNLLQLHILEVLTSFMLDLPLWEFKWCVCGSIYEDEFILSLKSFYWPCVLFYPTPPQSCLWGNIDLIQSDLIKNPTSVCTEPLCTYFGNCSDMYLLVRISCLAEKFTQVHKFHETRSFSSGKFLHMLKCVYSCCNIYILFELKMA